MSEIEISKMENNHSPAKLPAKDAAQSTTSIEVFLDPLQSRGSSVVATNSILGRLKSLTSSIVASLGSSESLVWDGGESSTRVWIDALDELSCSIETGGSTTG